MSKEEIVLFDEHQFKSKNKKFELKTVAEDKNIIKSKDRVQQHGEVFTPKWMVKKMLAEPSIQEKLHDLNATFFEPSAGEGAFLKEILQQKLNYVDNISSKSSWKRNALWALMSIYAIELLNDNVIKAKSSMIEIFVNHYQVFMQKLLSKNTDVYKSAEFIIKANIVQGNTLTYLDANNKLIEFSEWIPVENGVKRKIFAYKSLFNNDNVNDITANNRQINLFDDLDSKDIGRVQVSKVTKVFEMEY